MVSGIKRIGVVGLIAVWLMFSVCLPAIAAEKVLFSEDFSSNNFNKWTNTRIDPNAYEYTNANDGMMQVKNGQLVCDSLTGVGTFSFLGAKGIKVKNFTYTAKLKINKLRPASAGDGSWVGIHFRKESQDRMNVTNGILLFLRLNADKTVTAECGAMYGDSASWLRGKVGGKYTGDTSGWLQWRVDVCDSVFTVYVNNEEIDRFEYKSMNQSGYFSVNHCAFNGILDDIKITEYTAPTAKPSTPSGKTQPQSGNGEQVITIPSGKVIGKNVESSTSTNDSPSVSVPNESTVPATETPTVTIQAVKPIQTRYTDIMIDYVFYVIALSRKLTVSEFTESFKLSDRYTLQLQDADGNKITNQDMTVSDKMKAVLLLDGSEYSTYTIRLDYDENASTSVQNTETTLPKWALILIIAEAVVILANTTLLFLLTLRKKK